MENKSIIGAITNKRMWEDTMRRIAIERMYREHETIEQIAKGLNVSESYVLRQIIRVELMRKRSLKRESKELKKRIKKLKKELRKAEL